MWNPRLWWHLPHPLSALTPNSLFAHVYDKLTGYALQTPLFVTSAVSPFILPGYSILHLSRHNVIF
jgi:hypothetical protein